MNADEPGRSFNFVLCDEFSMFCVSAAIDALRGANLATGQKHYSWRIISHDGTPVRASNGMVIDCESSVDAMPSADITFVVASGSLQGTGHQRIINALRNLGRRGAQLGAMSVGTHLLAQAGQLENYRCTIHWEHRAVFTEAFPNSNCTGAVYEIDRNRYTAAGGTTGIDLMLALVRDDFGAVIANKVANNFQYEHIRDHQDRQRISIEPDLSGKSEKLKRVAELMADNLEYPLNAGALAASVQLSVRQVERLFLKHLNSTPGRYYMLLRLERARQLLRQTNMPILEVALATGFTSHSYFAQSYRLQFGQAPSEERR